MNLTAEQCKQIVHEGYIEGYKFVSSIQNWNTLYKSRISTDVVVVREDGEFFMFSYEEYVAQSGRGEDEFYDVELTPVELVIKQVWKVKE